MRQEKSIKEMNSNQESTSHKKDNSRLKQPDHTNQGSIMKIKIERNKNIYFNISFLTIKNTKEIVFTLN